VHRRFGFADVLLQHAGHPGIALEPVEPGMHDGQRRLLHRMRILQAAEDHVGHCFCLARATPPFVAQTRQVEAMFPWQD
jgi:hypothetical protein